MSYIQNPIIKGFNPDPSICRVGNTYYLVTSTFEYFPGITIYKSKNLVNWDLIGHCLNDNNSLILDGCRPSGGLYAPTIRYHKGSFFITCTNVSDKGNFIIYSDSITGPWKGPFWVEQGGIDPSLFFDTDGKCYLHSSVEHDGRHDIMQCEIDPYSGVQITESKPITVGSGGKYPEAPHMYKLFGFYYLILAEGGTEYGHMVTIHRADNPWGPFESYHGNPILSHRGLNAQYSKIQCVGHADIVEDTEGQWWLVALGIRPVPGVLLHNLGRETFLAKLSWNLDNWPTVNSDGLLTETVSVKPDAMNDSIDFDDDFSDSEFPKEYLFLRNPDFGKFLRNNNKLIITASDSINSLGSPSIACIRQKDWNVGVSVTVDLSESLPSSEAGLSVYYCNNQHYDLYLKKEDDDYTVIFDRTIYDVKQRTEIKVNNPKVKLIIDSNQKKYSFSALDGVNLVAVGEASIFGMCTEISSTMTFTGAMFAVYCEKGSAVFERFTAKYIL